MSLRDFDSEAVDQLARAVAKSLSDTRQPRANWDRRLTMLIGALTVVSAIFTFGVNWSRIAANETRIESSAKRIDVLEQQIIAVRQEQNSTWLTVQGQLGDIKAQLGQIQGALTTRK